MKDAKWYKLKDYLHAYEITRRALLMPSAQPSHIGLVPGELEAITVIRVAMHRMELEELAEGLVKSRDDATTQA